MPDDDGGQMDPADLVCHTGPKIVVGGEVAVEGGVLGRRDEQLFQTFVDNRRLEWATLVALLHGLRDAMNVGSAAGKEGRQPP